MKIKEAGKQFKTAITFLPNKSINLIAKTFRTIKNKIHNCQINKQYNKTFNEFNKNKKNVDNLINEFVKSEEKRVQVTIQKTLKEKYFSYSYLDKIADNTIIKEEFEKLNNEFCKNIVDKVKELDVYEKYRMYPIVDVEKKFLNIITEEFNKYVTNHNKQQETPKYETINIDSNFVSNQRVVENNNDLNNKNMCLSHEAEKIKPTSRFVSLKDIENEDSQLEQLLLAEIKANNKVNRLQGPFNSRKKAFETKLYRAKTVFDSAKIAFDSARKETVKASKIISDLDTIRRYSENSVQREGITEKLNHAKYQEEIALEKQQKAEETLSLAEQNYEAIYPDKNTIDLFLDYKNAVAEWEKITLAIEKQKHVTLFN